MSNPAPDHPTTRFTGLASLYARCRPGYPEAALDLILKRCNLGPNSLLVDVGCGTGISSRLFAQRGVPVLGIEPNADMRGRADVEPVSPGLPVPMYREGEAEATGLANGIADAVMAAQAFHWFQPQEALREFHRILKPGGWVVLIWNERNEADSFTAAFGAVIRSTPEARAIEVPRRGCGQALLRSPLFSEGEYLCFPHEQSLDEEGLLGRAFSMSYAPREEVAARDFEDRLRAVFARFQQGGEIVLRYETAVYLARRKGEEETMAVRI